MRFAKTSIALASVLTVLANQPALADEGQILEPSSKWHLDTGAERCRLAREFGEGSAKHILFLETDQPGSSVGFLFAGPAMEGLDPEIPVSLQFGQLDPIVLDNRSQGSLEGYGAALMSSHLSLDENLPAEMEAAEETKGRMIEAPDGLPRLAWERFEDAESLTIAQNDAKRAQLSLPSLHKALKTLNLCSEDLVTYWGLDLEKHRSMQRGPEWMNSRYIIGKIGSEFNGRAWESRGTVRFLLIIDETGRVEECRQSNVTQFDDLEPPACKLMRRSRFKPALDANGLPMRSYYASKIQNVVPSP